MLNVSTLWEMIHHFLNNIWQRQLFWTRSGWIMSLSLRRKKTKNKSMGTCVYAHTGWGNLAVLFCFLYCSSLWTGSENITVALMCITTRCGLSLSHFHWNLAQDLSEALTTCSLGVAVWLRRMIITAGQRKLRMSVRLINNKCHRVIPMTHISTAFTLHLRHNASMKWEPEKITGNCNKEENERDVIFVA